jgi:hypothetical protein
MQENGQRSGTKVLQLVANHCANNVRHLFKYYLHLSITYSEQMLVDCDAYNHGCHGGDYTKAWQYILEKGGAMKSSVYPYISGVNNQTVGFFINF